MNSSNKIKNYYADAFYQLSTSKPDLQIIDTDINNYDVLNDIAAKLASDFKADKNGQILNIAVSENLTQEELTSVLSNVDIEALHGESALILAYAKQNHAGLDFGEVNEPRLKGLIKYYRFNYLNQITFASEITRHINEAGEIPLSSYDFAMKYYMSEYFRPMDSSILAASKESYESILKLVKSLGYRVHRWPHSLEILSKGSRNHQQSQTLVSSHSLEIPSKSGSKRMRVYRVCAQFPESTLQYAQTAEIFNAKYLMPSQESLVYAIVHSIWQKLRNGCLFYEIAFALWDLNSVLNRQADKEIRYSVLYDMLLENNMTMQYLLVSRFVNEVIPNALKENIFANEEILNTSKEKTFANEATTNASKEDIFANEVILKTSKENTFVNEATTNALKEDIFANEEIPNAPIENIFESIEDKQIGIFLENEMNYIKSRYKASGELRYKAFRIGLEKLEQLIYRLIDTGRRQ